MGLRGLGMGSGGEKAMIQMVHSQTTYQGQLHEEKEHLERRLADINAVLGALEKSPEVANILEAINRLNY